MREGGRDIGSEGGRERGREGEKGEKDLKRRVVLTVTVHIRHN